MVVNSGLSVNSVSGTGCIRTGDCILGARHPPIAMMPARRGPGIRMTNPRGLIPYFGEAAKQQAGRVLSVTCQVHTTVLPLVKTVPISEVFHLRGDPHGRATGTHRPVRRLPHSDTVARSAAIWRVEGAPIVAKIPGCIQPERFAIADGATPREDNRRLTSWEHPVPWHNLPSSWRYDMMRISAAS